MAIKIDKKKLAKDIITEVKKEVIKEAKKSGLKADSSNDKINISGEETKVKEFIKKIK